MTMDIKLSMAFIYYTSLLLASFVQFLVADFIVTNYGADATGKTDSTTALRDAWAAACAGSTRGVVVVPQGTYSVQHQTIFSGTVNCKTPPIKFLLEGTLVAPETITTFKNDSIGWLTFHGLTDFTLSGVSAQTSVINGNGATSWKNCQCYSADNKCTMLSLNSLTNTVIRNITFLHSKKFHIKIRGCNRISIDGIVIASPESSPNTDGVHITRSKVVRIEGANIGTGDDCVSLGEGSQRVSLKNVHCGPGHGISIGSLGNAKGEWPVRDITVTDCTLLNTKNGLRIKSNLGTNVVNNVTNVSYENIKITNSKNPIIIDQEYCNHECPGLTPSKVQLTNIHFRNIVGTSASPYAITLKFSGYKPCQGLVFGDIYLTYKGGVAQTFCDNVQTTSFYENTTQYPEVACGDETKLRLLPMDLQGPIKLVNDY